jgi:hypothetical protein
MRRLPQDAEALRALILASFAKRDATIADGDAAVAERDILPHLYHFFCPTP